FFRRMDLKRKFFLGVEQFNQQRKTWSVRNVAEDFLSMLAPEFVERFAFQRPIRGDTLRLRAIDNLPRFTDSLIWWQLLGEELSEFAAAPDAFLENGRESQRREGSGHSSEVRRFEIVDCESVNAKETVLWLLTADLGSLDEILFHVLAPGFDLV